MPTTRTAKAAPSKRTPAKSAPAKSTTPRKSAPAKAASNGSGSESDHNSLRDLIVDYIKKGDLDWCLTALDDAISDRIAAENDKKVAAKKAAAPRSTIKEPTEVPAPVKKSIALKVGTVYAFSAAATAKKPDLKGLRVKFIRHAKVNGSVDKSKAFCEVTTAVSGFPKGANKVFPSAVLIPAASARGRK